MARSRRSGRLTWVVGVLVVAGVAIGCSSGTGAASTATTTTVTATGSPVVARAIETTTAATSARVEFTAAAGTDEAVVQSRITGVLDLESGSGTSVAESAGSRIELRIDGERSWVRVTDTPFASLVPPGTEWLEAPSSELAKRGVISMDNDVTWAPVLMLSGATDVAPGDRDGEWTFAIDPQTVRTSLPPAQLRAVNATLGDLLQEYVTTTGTLTVDSAGRVSHLVLRAEVDAPGRSGDGVIEFTLAISGYDEPVTVEHPAPEVVVTTEQVPSLLDRMTGPGPGY